MAQLWRAGIVGKLIVVAGLALIVAGLFAVLAPRILPQPVVLPERGPGYVTRADLGAAWPLTVDEGELRCEPGSAVVFDDWIGRRYAVNGTAKTRGDWQPIDEIWADDPQNAGLKIDLGPLIERGLALCS